MQYRRLGNAGMKVSAVSLGGWTTFGGSIQELELANEIITGAYEAAINFYDIADVYARGESEKMMGKVLAQFPRHTFLIGVFDRLDSQDQFDIVGWQLILVATGQHMGLVPVKGLSSASRWVA